MSYYRFPINLWMQYVTRCMPVPSNHSNVRIQGLHERVHKCAHSTPVGSILEFLKPFFDFVDEAVDSGRSVLVHCVAGAHRAATAGCLLLMHYHQLGAKVRVHTAPTVMPTYPLHGAFTVCGCARTGCHDVHAQVATSDRAEGCAAAATRALRASRSCGVGCGRGGEWWGGVLYDRVRSRVGTVEGLPVDLCLSVHCRSERRIRI